MIQPVYRFFCNEATRLMVALPLEPLLPLFPCWVREMYVDSYNQEVKGDLIECNLQADYRRVQWTVYSDFFSMTAECQRDCVIHEFYHAVLGEVTGWVDEALLKPVKEQSEAMHGQLQEEWRWRMERAIQELVFMTREVLPGGA